MSTEARLEALERGQTEILEKLGDVQGELGEVKGALSAWMKSADSLAEAVTRVCAEKHDRVDARLDSIEKRVKGDGPDSHETRLQALEKARVGVLAGWSLTRKIGYGSAAFAAFVATVIGIVEAVTHW